jgi:hypothetical protein
MMHVVIMSCGCFHISKRQAPTAVVGKDAKVAELFALLLSSCSLHSRGRVCCVRDTKRIVAVMHDKPC